MQEQTCHLVCLFMPSINHENALRTTVTEAVLLFLFQWRILVDLGQRPESVHLAMLCWPWTLTITGIFFGKPSGLNDIQGPGRWSLVTAIPQIEQQLGSGIQGTVGKEDKAITEASSRRYWAPCSVSNKQKRRSETSNIVLGPSSSSSPPRSSSSSPASIISTATIKKGDFPRP